MRFSNPLLLASLGALLAAASCTLITDVDRSKIPDGQAGSPGSNGGDGPMMSTGGEPNVPIGGSASGGEPAAGGTTSGGGVPAVDGGSGGSGGVPSTPEGGSGGAGDGGTPGTPEGGAGGGGAGG